MKKIISLFVLFSCLFFGCVKTPVKKIKDIIDFNCVMSKETADVMLSWKNGESYESIDIYKGNNKITTIDGDKVNYIIKFETYGIFDLRITANKKEQTTTEYCQINIGKLVWDKSPDAIIGFNVFIWSAEDKIPTEPSYVIKENVSEISLRELFDNDALIETKNSIELKVALTAFNKTNESGFSNIVLFLWETCLREK